MLMSPNGSRAQSIEREHTHEMDKRIDPLGRRNISPLHRNASTKSRLKAGSVVVLMPQTSGPAFEGGKEYGTLPGMGLQLARRLSYDSWLRIGKQLSVIVNSSAWCLGDWLAYGEVAYTGRYRDAIESTSLDYQTLRNYAWVAKRFTLSRRRTALSFGHHAEVAALPEPEQEFWLRKAEGLGWSRNELRREVRASLRERRTGPQAAYPDPPAREPSADVADRDEISCHDDDLATAEWTLTLKVSQEQLASYTRTAQQKGLSLQAWAVQVIDQAASLLTERRCQDRADGEKSELGTGAK
jgi:hypothetical protein